MKSSLANIKAGLESAAAASQTWPSSPTAIGKAILAFTSSAIPPAPSNPLVAALMSHAVDTAAFDAFLSNSYLITQPASTHPLAVSMGHPFWTSSLQTFLVSGGSISDAAAINGLPSLMSEGDLSVWLIDVKKRIDTSALEESTKQSIAQQAAAMAAAMSAAMPSVSSNPHALPYNVNVTVDSDQNKKASEVEQRQLSQLRLDAEYIISSPDALKVITDLIHLRVLDDDSFFASKIAEVKDEHILRLVHSDLDITKALAGGYEAVAQHVHALRSVLERRLETAVLGRRSSSVSRSDRLVRAFRNIRRGNLSKLRILHVLDLDDSGTNEVPLKAFHSMSRSEAAAKIGTCLNRVTTALCICFPSKNGNIMFFISAFIERMQKIIQDGVAWPAINKYFKAIFGLATRPASRHALGQGVWSAPDFQESWLHEASDFHDDLMEARMEAKVDKSSGDKSSPGKSKRERELEQQLANKKKGDKDKGNKPKIDIAKKGETIQQDGNGKYLKMPAKDHKVLEDWNKANPKEGGKFICWAHQHLKGGCPYKQCKNKHK